MFNIEFYKTVKGYSDIFEFLEALRIKAGTSKDARIQYSQVLRCIELLQENGTNLPIGIVKHLQDEIWELRPGNNRVFLFYYDKNTYVLLHHYQKKTQKTPKREISRAITEMNDYISRKETDDELE